MMGYLQEAAQSTGDHASLDCQLIQGEHVADSDLDTASGVCIMCSDIDEVSIQTAW